MNTKASSIPYTTPHLTAHEYATCAIQHLKTLEVFDPRILAYMLAPSNVLALAGLRSFSPYNDELRFTTKLTRFNKILASYGFLWMNEQPHLTNPTLASYALVNIEVASRLHTMYPLDAVAINGTVPERSSWGFFAWQAGLDISLARAMEQGALPKEWLRDWWSPMNVRFGMLLGYSGVAISSFVQAEVDEQQQNLRTLTISTGLFNSAAVGFAIAKDLLTEDTVMRTVETWRATLAEVYRTYPEDELMADSAFSTIVNAKA